MYLCITVTFLTDYYHGEQWPPPPSQLFQALVAGNKAGGRGAAWTEEKEKALKWLEGRPPPIIVAPKAKRLRHYLAYGPDNIMDIILTEKPKKKESEIKVPLHFRPWLVGEGKSVHYLWETEEMEERVLDTLQEMVQYLFSLGKGEDFVSSHLSLLRPEEAEGLEGEKYLPTEDSNFRLGVPYPGFLSELLEYHRRCKKAGRSEMGRPGLLVPEQGYRKSSTLALPPKRSFAAFLLRSPEGKTFSLPWEDAILLVAWTRHALAERLRGSWEDKKVDEYVLGHTKSPNRLSYLPLPSIGHPHAGGGIRRIIIVFPPGQEEKKVRRFLPHLVLTEGGARIATLEPIGREDPVLRLYLGPHSEWATVTPVVLHGHDKRRGKFSPSKTKKLILQAFEEAGYPSSLIREVEFRKAPFHPGTGRAEGCRTPSHLSKWPKYHVRVRFAEEVEGPIVVGVGRHYGIGLFAPLS